jgi:hypothetical protein
LVIADRLAFKFEEVNQDIENTGGKLLSLVEDVQVLLEDECELLGAHTRKNDRL